MFFGGYIVTLYPVTNVLLIGIPMPHLLPHGMVFEKACACSNCCTEFQSLHEHHSNVPHIVIVVSRESSAVCWFYSCESVFRM